MNIVFDKTEDYTEEYYDEVCTPSTRQIRYEEETKYFTFLYEIYDQDGPSDKELLVEIELCYKVIPPDCTTWDSDWDYYGYRELTAWDVVSVQNEEGQEVDPKNILTAEDFIRYNSEIEISIEG